MNSELKDMSPSRLTPFDRGECLFETMTNFSSTAVAGLGKGDPNHEVEKKIFGEDHVHEVGSNVIIDQVRIKIGEAETDLQRQLRDLTGSKIDGMISVSHQDQDRCVDRIIQKAGQYKLLRIELSTDQAEQEFQDFYPQKSRMIRLFRTKEPWFKSELGRYMVVGNGTDSHEASPQVVVSVLGLFLRDPDFVREVLTQYLVSGHIEEKLKKIKTSLEIHQKTDREIIPGGLSEIATIKNEYERARVAYGVGWMRTVLIQSENTGESSAVAANLGYVGQGIVNYTDPLLSTQSSPFQSYIEHKSHCAGEQESEQNRYRTIKSAFRIVRQPHRLDELPHPFTSDTDVIFHPWDYSPKVTAKEKARLLKEHTANARLIDFFHSSRSFSPKEILVRLSKQLPEINERMNVLLGHLDSNPEKAVAKLQNEVYGAIGRVRLDNTDIHGIVQIIEERLFYASEDKTDDAVVTFVHLHNPDYRRAHIDKELNLVINFLALRMENMSSEAANAPETWLRHANEQLERNMNEQSEKFEAMKQYAHYLGIEHARVIAISRLAQDIQERVGGSEGNEEKLFTVLFNTMRLVIEKRVPFDSKQFRSIIGVMMPAITQQDWDSLLAIAKTSTRK